MILSMDLADLFIELGLNCNKSSCSLSEDLLSQIINSMYKFFNPFISNGNLIIDTLRIASRRVCILYIFKEIVIYHVGRFSDGWGVRSFSFLKSQAFTIHLKIWNLILI